MITDLITKTLRGKTLYRILFERMIADYRFDVKGVCVDLAAGRQNISERDWSIFPDKLIRMDIDEKFNPDIVSDFNKILPLDDNFADNIFFFNSFYMLENPKLFLGEVYRVLKKGGQFFFTVEFIKAEESRVTDRQRFASRKIEELLKMIGFSEIKIIPIGGRFSASTNLFDFALGSSFIASILKIPGRLLSILFDYLAPSKLINNYACPISWFVAAKK